MIVSKLLIWSFYIVVIGICMAIGVTIGRLVREAFEIVGFVAGAIVGIVLSYWLWITYGKKLSEGQSMSFNKI